MKKIISVLLALIFVALPLLTSSAQAALLEEYGGVLVHVPFNRELLEKAFREYVKDLANRYFIYIDNGKEFYFSKHYYEASDMKATFDKKNKNLAYNTNEAVSKQDYKQQKSEIVFNMLTNEVQNIADGLLSLSDQEKANFFPGVVIDIATGEIKVNNANSAAQNIYNNKVEADIQKGATKAGFLFADTFIDIGVSIFYSGGKEVKDYGKKVFDVIEKQWLFVLQQEYEQEENRLKNLYREAMKQELIAAQGNVNTIMYDELNDMLEELKAENPEDTDSIILEENLDRVLKAIEEATTIEGMLSTEYNGATISAELDAIAEKAVEDLGLHEEILRSQEELFALQIGNLMWEIGMTIFDIVADQAKDLIKDKVSAQDLGKIEKVIIDYGTKIIETTISEAVNDIQDQILGKNEGKTLNQIIKEDGLKIAETITKKIITDVGKFSMEDILYSADHEEYIDLLYNEYLKLDKLEENLSEAKAEVKASYGVMKNIYSDSTKVEANEQVVDSVMKIDKKKAEIEDIINNHPGSSKDKWKKQWDDSTKANMLSAVIQAAKGLGESSLDLYNAAASLGYVAGDEVTVSRNASLMYQTRTIAEEKRDEINRDFSDFVSPQAIDAADLERLKEFMDAGYFVLHTDSLGNYYYFHLAAWHDYQQNPEMDRKMEEEVDKLFQEKMDAAWEKGNIGQKGLVLLNKINPAWYIAKEGTKQVAVADSEYLEKVSKESKLGSWLSTDEINSNYGELIELRDQFDVPTEYLPLFE